jgi:hypothetical protein
MKTPREVLLARHKAVEPKLDEIRRDVVADLTPHSAGETEIPFVLRLGRELILPRPRAWAAVAAMWVVIFALKLSTPGTPQVVVQKSSASPEVLAEVRQQKLLFAELVGVVKPRVAVPAKSASPQPRSDRRLRIPIG